VGGSKTDPGIELLSDPQPVSHRVRALGWELPYTDPRADPQLDPQPASHKSEL
jgi:hypothetical protein